MRWIVGLTLLACAVPGEPVAAQTAAARSEGQGLAVIHEIPYPRSRDRRASRSLDLYQPSERRGRSHHVTAMTGVAHGGLALPLESYSPEVWASGRTRWTIPSDGPCTIW